MPIADAYLRSRITLADAQEQMLGNKASPACVDECSYIVGRLCLSLGREEFCADSQKLQPGIRNA